MSRPARALVGAAAATASPFLVCAAVASEDFLVRFFPDDAFYYLQPAFNFARLGVSTFDSVHFTNGYHPLNFVLLTLLAGWTTKSGLLRLAFALDAVMLAAACAILAQQFGRELRASLRSVVLAAMMLPLFNVFIVLSMGLEAALVVLCTALLAAAWTRFEATSDDDSLSSRGGEGWGEGVASIPVGLALAALWLARLDLVFAIAPLIVLFIRHLILHSGCRIPQSAFPIPIVPLICLGTYVAINLALTGYPAPISAYVKGLDIGLASWRPSTRGTWIGWCLAAAPFAASVAILIAGWQPSRRIPSIIRWLNVANLAFGVYLVLGVDLAFRWYFSFPAATLLANVAWAGTLAARRFSQEPRTRHAPAVAVVAIAAAVAANTWAIVWIGTRSSSTSFHLKSIAGLVDRSGGPHAVTATTDAGVIGFFGQARVINLDGLANDFVYLNEYLRRGRVAAYLRQEGVTHYLVRDGHLLNRAAVVAGQYTEARVSLDPRLVLHRENELFRYEIPGQFQVIYYRLVLIDNMITN